MAGVERPYRHRKWKTQTKGLWKKEAATLFGFSTCEMYCPIVRSGRREYFLVWDYKYHIMSILQWKKIKSNPSNSTWQSKSNGNYSLKILLITSHDSSYQFIHKFLTSIKQNCVKTKTHKFFLEKRVSSFVCCSPRYLHKYNNHFVTDKSLLLPHELVAQHVVSHSSSSLANIVHDCIHTPNLHKIVYPIHVTQNIQT